MAPIHLGLLPRQSAQAQISLRLRAWPVVGDQMAEMIWPAGVAAFAHHGVQATGGQLGKLLQGLTHEGQEGIEQRGLVGTFQLGQASLGQYPIDRAMMDAELPCNGAHPPLLHMEITENLCFEFRGYRQRSVLLLIAQPSRNTFKYPVMAKPMGVG